MGTEELVSRFIDEGIRCYKKVMKKDPLARRIERHEEVDAGGGAVVTCWREFATVRMALHIKEVLPDSELEITLDGNDSTLQVSLTEEEQEKLNSYMYTFLNKHCGLSA